MTDVYIGLGANLGDRRENLRSALRMMPEGVTVAAVSSLYETEAVTADGEAQPRYYNAAARLETKTSPRELLRAFQNIERELGRERTGVRWSPRPIDIDLLLYGDEVIRETGLSVPHPRMRERAFVLVPLAEIAADVVHPTLGRTVGELASEAGDEGVVPVEDTGWFD
jgi:2-amino-4-hydroxy-6-hydroxymethyldihydropteridine diphosphokinase